MNEVFENVKLRLKPKKYPHFRVGDVIKLQVRVREGGKERIQTIEGSIIAHKHGFQPGATITLRKISFGVAVELIFPLFSPNIKKIDIAKRQKVHQAKLYYLRRGKNKKGKFKEEIKKEEIMIGVEKEVSPEEIKIAGKEKKVIKKKSEKEKGPEKGERKNKEAIDNKKENQKEAQAKQDKK
ncbi:MAG: 50S ribosomal protein L19 [Candidatus Moranbacteria bacterium]|nr:50S ribosomal protein L19 [Candidatus Moranbacteria bacterium]